MPISSTVKGIQSIKTMHTSKKSAIPNNAGSDFIKLYMLEKEKTRLQSEAILISLRLNTLQIRLNEIQEFYDEKSILLQNHDMAESFQTTSAEENQDFKTVSIEY